MNALEELPFEREAMFALELAHLRPGGPPILGLGLDVLRRHTGARTVRDVADREAAAVLERSFPRSDRRAFMRAFLDAVKETAGERRIEEAPLDEAGAPRPSFDPERPPRGGAALERWAAELGVEGALDRTTRLGAGARAETLTLRECMDLERCPMAGRRQGWDRAELRAWAHEELLAITHGMEARARFLSERRAPEDAWIAERVARLRALLDEAVAARVPVSERYPNVEVTFAERPMALLVWAKMEGARFPYAVHLETGRVTYGTDGAADVPLAICEHAALASAIDALLHPTSKALADLVAWRTVPEWQRAVDRFEARAGAASKEGERIGFVVRVGPSPRGPLVEVVTHRPTKTGGLRLGRALDRRTARGMDGLSPVEREIVELATLLHENVYDAAECTAARGRVLELLAVHPRVYVARGQEKTPATVRRTRPTLHLVPAEGGVFTLEVGVGDVRFGAVAARRQCGSGLLCLFEPEPARIHFALLDAATLALLAAFGDRGEGLPAEALDRILARLASLPPLAADLVLPEEVRGERVDADATPIVQLSLAGDRLSIAPRVRPIAGGPAFVPGQGAAETYATQADGRRVHAVRDLEGEVWNVERVLAELPLRGAARAGELGLFVDDADQACDVVAALRELGAAVTVEWEEEEKVRFAGSARTPGLRLNITRDRDWFGLDGEVDVDGVKVSLAALLDAVRRGRRFVRLEGGRLVAIERELRRRLARAADVVRAGRGGDLAVHAPGVEAIAALVEHEAQITAAREWLELRERMRRAEASEPEPPEGLRAELRGYQREGFRWLMRLASCGAGACLADDMGLGKTLQSLAVLEARKGEGPALVVAPTSVCANWLAEAAKFAPGLEVLEYRGASRSARLEGLGPGRVLVASWDLVARDAKRFEALDFATVVFDEAQAIKNGQSKRALAAQGLSAAFRIALTGTPVENHTGDLWSIFRATVPGLFGSWEDFRRRFAVPIERDGDVERREALAAMVRPFLLRRTKREVSPELPAKTEVVHLVEQGDEERAIYEAERLKIVASLGGGPRTAGDGRFEIFAALTRLRQLACHARLRDPDATAPSAKLEAALALVEELREAGHKALVFSQFTSHLALVAEELRRRGVRFFELDGSTPADARADRVRRFQAGEAELFLVSLKAGGTGLNLTAADYVIHLDPWWNPAAEDQASDRAHRIGQDKPVTVVRFVTKSTIEEKVLALHAEKRDLADAILAGGDAAGRLTTEELFALIEDGAAERG